MNDNQNIKRSDQISLLEIVRDYTDSGDWKGSFTYPNCGCDLVQMGLATEDKKITEAGRVALWLLGKGPDVTDSKAIQEFKFPIDSQPSGPADA